ncbi:MAG: 3-oxoacyl-ACP reductase family protein [Litorilinea sp.]
MPTSLGHLLDFSDQVAIVTGASRGIGKATARLLAQGGASVALVSRSQADLEQTAHELTEAGCRSDRLLPIAADMADVDQIQHMVDAVTARWSRVDILVNNAALMQGGPYSEIDLADWQRLIDANLTGVYACVRAVAPGMQARRFGRIINIASISGQTGGVSGGVHYATTKGGLIAMTKTLARDLAPDNVTVNAIAPGQIDTRPGQRDSEAMQRVVRMIPLGRLGAAEDIGYAVLYLASPLGAYVTGATLDVNGGILKR